MRSTGKAAEDGVAPLGDESLGPLLALLAADCAGEHKVKALHTVCPHLGCFIDYRAGKNDFYCPCHNSNFKLNGDILSGVSPRAMDPLEIEVRNTSEVWVKFQNFQPGHDHPVPVS